MLLLFADDFFRHTRATVPTSTVTTSTQRRDKLLELIVRAAPDDERAELREALASLPENDKNAILETSKPSGATR